MKKLGIVIRLPHPLPLARMHCHRSQYYPRNTAELGCHSSWALSIYLQSSLDLTPLRSNAHCAVRRVSPGWRLQGQGPLAADRAARDRHIYMSNTGMLG